METRSPDEARRGWQMLANDSTRSSAMSDVFVVLFTFLSVLLIGYLQSDPRSRLVSRARLSRVRVETSLHYLCVLALLDFAAPTSNFRLIQAVHFLSRV